MYDFKTFCIAFLETKLHQKTLSAGEAFFLTITSIFCSVSNISSLTKIDTTQE